MRQTMFELWHGEEPHCLQFVTSVGAAADFWRFKSPSCELFFLLSPSSYHCKSQKVTLTQEPQRTGPAIPRAEPTSLNRGRSAGIGNLAWLLRLWLTQQSQELLIAQ